MDGDFCPTLAGALEKVIWSMSAEELVAGAPFLHSLLAAAGGGVAQALAEMSDESLAVAMQKGFLFKAAFEECLVNRQDKALHRWFFKHARNEEQARDLTQALYLKLLAPSTLSAYDSDYPFRPWFWTVVHHFTVGEWRRRRPSVGLPEVEGPGKGPSPAEEASGRELEERIEAAIRELPDPRQQVIRLAWHEVSAPEIANRLGLTKQRVYQDLFKARRHVESALGLAPAGPCR